MVTLIHFHTLLILDLVYCRHFLKEHCKQFENHTVVCYYTECLEGLNIGGANGIHLMDLVVNNMSI